MDMGKPIKQQMKESMSALGAFGGNATVRKYGKKYMSGLAHKRWNSQKKVDKLKK